MQLACLQVNAFVTAPHDCCLGLRPTITAAVLGVGHWLCCEKRRWLQLQDLQQRVQEQWSWGLHTGKSAAITAQPEIQIKLSGL